LFAYLTNERSSRGIERRCRQDIVYRVITGNQVPDHATIARFIKRHQSRLAELFTSVLRLCASAGLVRSGIVAVDGTKVTASASSDSNVDYDRIAREIIAGAIATDEAEDGQHGETRGDELPSELRTAAGRRAWLERELSDEHAEGESGEGTPEESEGEPPDGFDPEQIDPNGRRAWLREAHRQLDQQRWRQAAPMPRSRADRLRQGARFLEDQLAAERRRGTGRMRIFASTGVCMTSGGSVDRRSRGFRPRSRKVVYETIGETLVKRDDGGIEGDKNESAFYGRIIRRAKGVRERAAESLRRSRVLRKRQEQADAAERRRRFRRGA
jgi:hypothetical protein